MGSNNRSATLQIVIAGDASKLGKTIKGAGNEVTGLGNQLRGMAPKIAAGLTSAAVLKWTKDAVGSYKAVVGEVAQLKRVTGESAENASLLRFAAQQSGITVQKLATSWGIFSKNIASGAVEKAGLEIRGTNGELLASGEILGQVADKFAAMPDGPEKTALALKLFGRSGADMIKILNKGSDGIAELREEMRRLGVEVSDDDLNAFKEYTAAQRDFQAASTGLKQTVGREILPLFTALAQAGAEDLPKVARGLDTVTNAIGRAGEITGLGLAGEKIVGPLAAGAVAVAGIGIATLTVVPVMKAGYSAVTGLAKGVVDLGRAGVAAGQNLLIPTRAVEGLGTSATAASGPTSGLLGLLAAAPVAVGVAGGVIGGAALILYDFAGRARLAEASIENLRAEAERTGKTIDETFKGQLAGLLAEVEGGFDVGQSDNLLRKTLDDAGISADELYKKLQAPKAEYAAFVRNLARSSGLSSTTFGQVSRDLDQLRGAAAGAEEKQRRLDEVNKDLGISTDDLGDEVDGTAGSIDRLAVAMGGFLADADEFGSGADAIASTGEAVNNAVIGVADAQEQVAEAQNNVAQAERSVADAQGAVADARRGVADAEEAVTTALEGVEDARRGVTEAEEAAVDARTGVAEATAALAQAERDAQVDSEAMAEALRGVEDAEKAVERSQADSLAAQEALTIAREGYDDVLKGLSRSAAGAADDVLSAEIRLRNAIQAAAELGQPDKNGDVQEVTADQWLAAQIAIREAQRALETAKEREAEARAEYERQQAAGVEGSDEVVAAHAAVTTAAENEQAAHRNLEGAVANVSRVQEDANRRVAAAQRGLRDAIDARAAADQRVVDAKQGVVDANDRVRDAAQGVADANGRVRDAVDGVRDAQGKVTAAKQGVVDARKAVEDAERKVESAVKDQYKAYKAQADLFAPGSAARERMEWLTNQMRLQHDYLLQPITTPFVDLFGGNKSSSGGTKGQAAPDAATQKTQTTGDRRVVAELHVHGVTDPMVVAEMALQRADFLIRERGRSR